VTDGFGYVPERSPPAGPFGGSDVGSVAHVLSPRQYCRFVPAEIAGSSVETATTDPSARTRFEAEPDHEKLNVPELVIGDPDAVNKAGTERPTLVTTPDQAVFPVPSVINAWLLFP
jgi:hypothetical protein